MRRSFFALIVFLSQISAMAMIESDLMAESGYIKSCADKDLMCFERIDKHFDEYRKRGRPEAFIYYHEKKHLRKSALLIHSFTMSPREMQKIGKGLVEKGFNVVGIHLEAHGERSSVVDMRNVSAEDWDKDFRYGLNIAEGLGDEVLVVGYSLGGLVAFNGAMKYPDEIKAVAGIAPALALRRGAETLSCLGRTLSETKFLNNISKTLTGHNLGTYEKSFLNGACAIKEMLGKFFPPPVNLYSNESELQKRWVEPMRERLSYLKVPVYVSLTENDEILDSETIDYILKDILTVSTTFYPAQKKIGHLSIIENFFGYSYELRDFEFNQDFLRFLKSLDKG